MTLDHFFAADLHFGHESIIRLCNRPYDSVEEMDESIITNWNNTIPHNGVVHVLGDFLYKSSKPASYYLKRLNGKKHLIFGNHDNIDCRSDPMWASVNESKFLKIDGNRFYLNHYPLREWPGYWGHTHHLFGHTHNTLKSFRRFDGNNGCCDVGIDAWDLRPANIHEILSRIAGLDGFDVRTLTFK